MKKISLAIFFLAFLPSAGIAAKGGFKDQVEEVDKARLCVSAFRYLDNHSETIKKKEAPSWEYWEERFVEFVPDEAERNAIVQTEFDKYGTMKRRTPVILARVYATTCREEYEYQIANEKDED